MLDRAALVACLKRRIITIGAASLKTSFHAELCDQLITQRVWLSFVGLGVEAAIALKLRDVAEV